MTVATVDTTQVETQSIGKCQYPYSNARTGDTRHY
jgi:hypothetical protein